jgi:hypothetical protein
MKITVTGTDTSVAGGDYSYIRHIIEGNNMNHLNWGSSNAKPVTLSFWVKSSVTGSHGGSLWNNAFDRSFPFNYSINFADTWEHKSITVPGCPDGTWETGTGRGINIGFVQLSGSSFTGSPGQWNSAGDVGPTTLVNLLATNGATWYITGIQLEIGSNATDFEHRSYGEELALCQRYYWKAENFLWLYSLDANANYVRCNIFNPVEMRVPPTITGSFSHGGSSNGYQSQTKYFAIPYVNSPTTIVNLASGAVFDAEF